MMRTLAFALLATLVLLPAAAPAQEPGQDEMAAMMAAVAPDENHDAMEQLVGSWSHELLFWPAPGAPPMEMTATSTSEMAMGGRYVRSAFAGSFLGMPFEGAETMGYDKMKGKYFTVWIDNFSTGPLVMWGDYDPTTKTFTFEGTAADPLSGNPEVPVRNTLQIRDDGSLHYENWGAGPDGEMFKSMEIRSTKQP